MQPHMIFLSIIQSPMCRAYPHAAAVLLCLFSTSAFSAECQLNISNPLLDYGRIATSGLQVSGAATSISLGKRSVILSVVCDHPSTISLVIKGEEAGAGQLKFSDGGAMTVRLSNAQLDGRSVELGKIPSGLLQPSEIGASVQLGDAQGAVPVSGQRVSQGSNFMVEANIEPVVPFSTTRVRNATTLQGQILFELQTK